MSVAVDRVVVVRRVVSVLPVEDELPVVLSTDPFLASLRPQIPVLDGLLLLVIDSLFQGHYGALLFL